MPRSIRKPVGLGFKAVNDPPDVMVVQEALNDVTPADGGPQPLLKVDGVCGSKTTKAIQMFQLHHFGWKGADGRVDPDGQTLAKLNEIAASRPARSTTFHLFEVKSQGVLLRKQPSDWFFLVELVSFRQPFPHAIFWFGPPGKAPIIVPSKAVFVSGAHTLAHAAQPCSLGELAGPALFRHLFDSRIEDERLNRGSQMETEPLHPVRFEFFAPVGMDPKEPLGPGVIQFELAGIQITEFRGQFQRVG